MFVPSHKGLFMWSVVFCCFCTGEAMSLLEKEYLNLRHVVLENKLQTDPVCNSLSQTFSGSDRVASVEWPKSVLMRKMGCSDETMKDQQSSSKELLNCHAYAAPMHEDYNLSLQPQSPPHGALNLSGGHKTISYKYNYIYVYMCVYIYTMVIAHYRNLRTARWSYIGVIDFWTKMPLFWVVFSGKRFVCCAFTIVL